MGDTMTAHSSRLPWFIVQLAPDAPWLCSRCRESFELLNFEDRIMFLIGLSPEGVNYLGGADLKVAIPTPGVVCRHCWSQA